MGPTLIGNETVRATHVSVVYYQISFQDLCFGISVSCVVLLYVCCKLIV